MLAANRDEMAGRPWRSPGRHWPEHPHVRAGLDEVAGGTWLGLNDDGLVAGVLNRVGTLGPLEGYRSRGELPLEALSHGTAVEAAEALRHLDPAAYRPFNMILADALSAFWLRSDGHALDVAPVPVGISMLTAHDLNDTQASPRQAKHLPRFRAAPTPDPLGDWFVWQGLLASRDRDPQAALCVQTESGFGTSSSSLIALPAPPTQQPPVWLFCPGKPGEADYAPVPLT
ncbi:NRDE family protein [Magnetospira thiophila]